MKMCVATGGSGELKMKALIYIVDMHLCFLIMLN